MAFSQQVLIEAAESGFHILNDGAPAVAPLEIPNVLGRVSPVSHPFPNGVTLARLEPAEADAVIQQVIGRFASEGKAFSWTVGPNSTPADLPSRLEAAGLQKVEEWAGLALADLSLQIPSNLAFRIEEIPIAKMRKRADLLVKAFGFGVNQEAAEVMVGIMEGLEPRYGTRAYLAFTADGEEPVAFSAMCRTPRPRVMNFLVSATLEEYRGKGVYKSLVARRLADARAQGAEAIVTQANRETSAPILQKLGITEICSFDMYAWMPQDS